MNPVSSRWYQSPWVGQLHHNSQGTEMNKKVKFKIDKFGKSKLKGVCSIDIKEVDIQQFHFKIARQHHWVSFFIVLLISANQGGKNGKHREKVYKRMFLI